MELCDRFNTDLWSTSELSKHQGFTSYTLIRPQFVEPGKFKYAIREIREDDVDCKMDMVTLDGACGKMDPLQSIRNCDLLVQEGCILGVCVDGDCVVKKKMIQ